MSTKRITPNIELRFILVAGTITFAVAALVMNARAISDSAPAACPPPSTPEPLWVEPVISRTTLLTQTIHVTLGRGREVTITSEAGTVTSTNELPSTFTAYTPFHVTIPLRPNTIHHLAVAGLVEYETGCFYTLSTSYDRRGNPLVIVQGTPSPPVYLPLIMGNAGSPSGPTIGGCPVFPPDNPWNRDISNDPVDSNSDNYIASINASGDHFLHADFGSNLDYGIPYTVVPGTQPFVSITFDEFGDESDPGPYPIPPNAPIEAGSDRHVLVVNSGNCALYELYHASKDASGPGWTAGSGAVFTLTSNTLRPDSWTSADQAGLPILPGLVRYDEVAAGEIRHAVRFTIWRPQRAWIHPATHYGTTDDPNDPPMGLRLRLNASYDISGYTGQARVVLEALKKYGMFVADTGTSWFITGATDPRWNDEDLDQLKQVPGSAFEAIQTGPIIRPQVPQH